MERYSKDTALDHPNKHMSRVNMHTHGHTYKAHMEGHTHTIYRQYIHCEVQTKQNTWLWLKYRLISKHLTSYSQQIRFIRHVCVCVCVYPNIYIPHYGQTKLQRLLKTARTLFPHPAALGENVTQKTCTLMALWPAGVFPSLTKILFIFLGTELDMAI